MCARLGSGSSQAGTVGEVCNAGDGADRFRLEFENSQCTLGGNKEEPKEGESITIQDQAALGLATSKVGWRDTNISQEDCKMGLLSTHDTTNTCQPNSSLTGF